MSKDDVNYLNVGAGETETVDSTVTFTQTLTASGGVTGDLTGDVIGTVTGTKPLEVVTTTNVIAATESGTTFVLNSATGFVSTLPAVASGLECTFIVGGTPPSSGNHTVVTATGDIIHGLVLYAPTDDAGAVDDNANTVSFVASQAQEGDWVTLVCDGTNWLVRGQAQVAEGITLTTAA